MGRNKDKGKAKKVRKETEISSPSTTKGELRRKATFHNPSPKNEFLRILRGTYKTETPRDVFGRRDVTGVEVERVLNPRRGPEF